ncbi:tetratricopeptide repeat protein [Sphingomonas sp. RS6]
MIRFSPLLLGAAAVVALPATSAGAQTEIVQQRNPLADALAIQMRVLAENPRDVDALLAAGQLSTRLGDYAGALAFFQRAEAVDATNPRILNGRASVLVRTERPGEALRLFQQAEARGVDPREYAADRAFAYDLLGQPLLAQRDYRLALSQRRNDEVVRRYALSLGISGDMAGALRELDPLVRAQDRPAWRARAFILAMNGDTAGAEKIAATMMPGNLGKEMLPFFRRLERMPPADRAFAVHFGELSPSKARLADARQAPTLPPYTPEIRPAQAAVVPPAPATGATRGSGRRGRTIATAPAAAAVAPAARPAVAASPRPEPNTLVPPRKAAEAPAAGRPIETAQAPAPRPTPAPAAVATRPAPALASPPLQRPARTPAEASALASIMSGITIPGEELELTRRPPQASVAQQAAPATKATGPVVAAGRAEPVAKAPPPKAEPVAAKPAPRKPAPKKPDLAKADPARVWVQVAGGANETMLPRAWKAVVAKAPAAFKGKSGWWTPLRATNRLLTGPFKTADEAQTFVNMLAKQGVSAFVFTSEPGQKVTRLAP